MINRQQGIFRRILVKAPWIYSVLPVLIIWEVGGRMNPQDLLPSLTQVFQAGLALAARGQLARDGIRTLSEIAQGFVLASVAGTVFGVLMGRYRLMEAFFGLYVDIFQSAPTSALVPVLILLFGLGSGSIVATVFLFTFFVITVNVYTGVKEANPRLIEMGRSFGAGEATLLWRIILPAALPMVLAGIRLGVGRAFNGAVLGEMLVSIVGIGGLLMSYGGAFKMDYLFALLFFIVLFAGLSMVVVQAVERRVLRWMR